MSWGYQALVLEKTRIIALPHLNEAQTLRKHGYSFFGAGLRGRYARVDYRICLNCGARDERAVLGFPVTLAGCLVVVATLVALTLAGVVGKLPWWLLPFIGIAGWLGLTWLSARLVRVLFRNRQRSLPDAKKCSVCGGTKLRNVASALQHNLPCPSCKKKTLRIRRI